MFLYKGLAVLNLSVQSYMHYLHVKTVQLYKMHLILKLTMLNKKNGIFSFLNLYCFAQT